MKSVQTTLKFTWASIKMFARNKSAFFWTLFVPLLIMVIFGFMNFENYGKSTVVIVDNAKNEQSKSLIDGLKKVDIISVSEMNEGDAKAKLEKGELDLVTIIPSDFLAGQFTQNMVVQSQFPPPTNITIYYNEGRKQQAMAGTTVLKETFDQINHQITKTPNLFNLDQKAVSSRNLKYIDFLVPGIMAMAVMQLGVFSIVFSIVEYRKKYILKRLLVTPMRPIEFIVGQVTTRIIVSVAQVSVLLAVGIFIFHLNVIGSYPLMFFVVILGALLFISMGFALSSLAKTEDSAAPVANVIVFPMMFLSGVFFPIEAMPQWLQNISYYFPLRFLAHGMRSVMTENASIIDIKTDIFGLLIWSGIMIVLAVWLFRFGQEE